MKKLVLGIAIMLVTATTAFGGEYLKLTTHGKVLTEIENLFNGYGSILVEIQDQIYAVEDTRIWKLRILKVRPGSKVLIGIWLNENDRIQKIHVIENL